MLFALIGAVIPHLPGLFSLFGKRTDDTATIEKAELRTVRVALRYASIRITLTCIIASVFAMWALAKFKVLDIDWNDNDYNIFHLVGTSGLSHLFNLVSRRL